MLCMHSAEASPLRVEPLTTLRGERCSNFLDHRSHEHVRGGPQVVGDFCECCVVYIVSALPSIANDTCTCGVEAYLEEARGPFPGGRILANATGRTASTCWELQASCLCNLQTKCEPLQAPLLYFGVSDMSILQSGGSELHKLSNDEDDHVPCRFNKCPNAASSRQSRRDHVSVPAFSLISPQVSRSHSANKVHIFLPSLEA
jgi:hypothetical protein